MCPGSKCFLWCPLCFIAISFFSEKVKTTITQFCENPKPRCTDGKYVMTSLKGYHFSHLALMTWGCLHHPFTTSHSNLFYHIVFFCLFSSSIRIFTSYFLFLAFQVCDIFLYFQSSECFFLSLHFFYHFLFKEQKRNYDTPIGHRTL